MDKLPKGDSSDVVRGRVEQARALQKARFKALTGYYNNAMMSPALLKKFCQMDKKATALLAQAMERLQLSARAYSSIRKVARTIADLAGSDGVLLDHVAEAIAYRNLDRAKWGE